MLRYVLGFGNQITQSDNEFWIVHLLCHRLAFTLSPWLSSRLTKITTGLSRLVDHDRSLSTYIKGLSVGRKNLGLVT